MPSSQQKGASKARTGRQATKNSYWSADVTRRSNALDLEPGVFKKRSAVEIARSLKRSAEHSKRRKGSPFQSAMSMLNFYINRAGKNLSKAHRKTLNAAKQRLREEFGRS